MSKERELLARCLEHLEWVTEFPEGDDMEKVAEEIRDYLMSPKPENIDTSEERVRESDISEAEPVAFISKNGFRFNADIEPIEHGVEVPLYLHPAPRKEFVRLSDEEITEIIGPYSMGTVGGYTRKLFDTIQDVLEEKNR